MGKHQNNEEIGDERAENEPVNAPEEDPPMSTLTKVVVDEVRSCIDITGYAFEGLSPTARLLLLKTVLGLVMVVVLALTQILFGDISGGITPVVKAATEVMS